MFEKHRTGGSKATSLGEDRYWQQWQKASTPVAKGCVRMMVPVKITPFVEEYREAKRRGDATKVTYMRAAWHHVLSEYHNRRAVMARAVHLKRLYNEARIIADYALASRLRAAQRVPLIQGTEEWEKWAKVSEDDLIHPTHQDKEKVKFADLMDRARVLRIIHLCTLYREATKSGDAAKTAALSQSMREPLESGSDQCKEWIEKAETSMAFSSQQDSGRKEHQCELAVLQRLLEAMDHGDRAKINELLHLVDVQSLLSAEVQEYLCGNHGMYRTDAQTNAVKVDISLPPWRCERDKNNSHPGEQSILNAEVVTVEMQCLGL